MSGENNPMYGKPCYHNMSEEEKQQWKDNISKGTKGKPKSELTKAKMRKPKPPQKQVICPHCKTSGGSNNMVRHHFDKCKLKPITQL